MPVLVKIDAYDPVIDGPVSLFAASHDDPGVCHQNAKTWWPAIAKLPTLRYDFFGGAFDGAITAPSSSITLQTEPWPEFGRYELADARFRLWTGAAGVDWASWVLRFDGRISDQPETAAGSAPIDFAVDDRWLDSALLSTYLGTTGAEGSASLKGQPKPLALGAPRYVAGALVDSVASIFQVSGYGAIHGIEAALERLSRFSAAVADYPTYATLAAATIAPGMWATSLAGGYARFGAPPAGQISFLVQGDAAGPDGWARKPGQLIRRIALLSGGAGKIDDSSLDALDAARPYNLSVYIDQQGTARDWIQKIAASVNAVAFVSWTGLLTVLPIEIGAPSVTLAADGSSLPPVEEVKQVATSAPWRRLALTAERAWTVHQLTDIAFTAPLLDLGDYDDTVTYREGNIVSLPDGSEWVYIATTPSPGHDPVIPSSFWSQKRPPVDAQTIGGRPVSEVLDELVALASDSILSHGSEKQKAVIDWIALLNQWLALDAKFAGLASPIELGATHSTAATAITALGDYLVSLVPVWEDLAIDTPIVAATWVARWNDAYDALSKLSAAIAEFDPNQTSFYDPMNYATAAAFVSVWNADRTSGIAIVPSPDTGGSSVQVGINVDGADAQNIFGPKWLPYSPEDLYEVSFDIDIQAAESGALFYAGVQAIDRDGNNLGGSYNYVAAAALDESANLGRKTYTGYFRGTAATTAGGVANDRANPTHLPDGSVSGFGKGGTVRVRPVALFHYPGKSGQTVLHSASLRKVTDNTIIWTGAFDPSRPAYYVNEGVTYLGRSFAAKRLMGATNTPPATATDDFNWYLIADRGQDGADGLDGTNGLPGIDGRNGIDGSNGQTPQFHFAWANSDDGTDSFTNGAQAGRTYQGVYIDYSSGPDSTDPDDYTWSRFTGQDGLDGSDGEPGPIGPDGQPTYVHKAYATSDDGSTGFSTTVTTGKSYLGLYIDNIAADSGDYHAYAWSLIKGADGTSPLSLVINPPAVNFAADYIGTVKPGQVPYPVSIKGNYQSSIETLTGLTVTAQDGCMAEVQSGNTGINITAISGASGTVQFTGSFAGQSVTGSVTFSTSNDPPPPQSVSNQSSLTTNFNTTSYPSNGIITSAVNASDTGKLLVGGKISFKEAGTGHRKIGKLQYRLAGAGSWTDVPGSEFTGSYTDGDAETHLHIAGAVIIGPVSPMTLTGLTPGAAYEVQIIGRFDAFTVTATSQSVTVSAAQVA